MPVTSDFHDFFMPAEWMTHERTWIAWPCTPKPWGDRFTEACDAYQRLAIEASRFEPVRVIVNPEDLYSVAHRFRHTNNIEVIAIPHDDAWIRDNGPTFIVSRNGELGCVGWNFNGWGEKYPLYERDRQVPVHIAQLLNISIYRPPLVLEGGAINGDGIGTMLATESSVLNLNRNPHLTKSEVEDYILSYTGSKKIIWLSAGLSADETDGHVDNVAAFIGPGTVAAHVTTDSHDPDYPVLVDNLQRLRTATDVAGHPLQIIEIEKPKIREVYGKLTAVSYINFYFVNGGIIVPVFGDPHDALVIEKLSKILPDLSVVAFDARDIVYGGGGIHCITQPQPKVP